MATDSRERHYIQRVASNMVILWPNNMFRGHRIHWKHHKLLRDCTVGKPIMTADNVS